MWRVYDTPMDPLSRWLALGLVAMVASWYVLPGIWARLLTFLGRRLTGLYSRHRTVGGVRWHYLESRRRSATLVLLHGLAAECDHWLAVAGNLRRQFHILIPDLPGFGASERPDQLSFRIADQSARLEAWLDELGVRQCVLAGSSMGGWIAADFAARHPGRVPALWLQNPFGVLTAEPSELLAGVERGERNPFAVRNPAEYRYLAEVMLSRSYHVPYPLLWHGYRLTRRLYPHLDRMQSEFLAHSESLESLAPRLGMPVLIEWGAKDRAVHVSGARILHGLLPHSELHVLEGVGHLPMLEQPFQSANLFLAFVARHGLDRDGTRAATGI